MPTEEGFYDGETFTRVQCHSAVLSALVRANAHGVLDVLQPDTVTATSYMDMAGQVYDTICL